MATNFPSQARVVIVGGGVMGVGLAYHLGHEHWGADTVLLEKAELTSGSTWHAAGQITHSTSSFGLGKCVDYNIGLYSGALESETGQAVTWHGCGSFRLAYTEDEMDWLRHTLSVGRSLGFNIELVGPERVRELHPFYNLEGVLGALHTPDDGHVDPTKVTTAQGGGGGGGARARAPPPPPPPPRRPGRRRGRHLAPPDGRGVGTATAHDLDDPPLLCDRAGAGI